MFVRPIFIIYFSALNIIAFGGLIFSVWSNWAISDESRKRRSQIFVNMNQKKMKHIVGLMFSIEGGLLASETLLLAKSGVKLFTLSISSQVNQFNDNASRFILLALLGSAILQVYCLNTALKLYSSVVVVPVFYGTYTAVGLVNTIIYLDEIGNYPPWAIILVFVGIAVLIYGVFLLSSKPDPASHLGGEESVVDQELDEMSPGTQHPNEQEQQQDRILHHWLSAKEEKDAVAIIIDKNNNIATTKGRGESSHSIKEQAKQDDSSTAIITNTSTNARISKFFKRLKYHKNNHPTAPPRREMDTFISLTSQDTTTTTKTATTNTIIPLAITITATTNNATTDNNKNKSPSSSSTSSTTTTTSTTIATSNTPSPPPPPPATQM